MAPLGQPPVAGTGGRRRARPPPKPGWTRRSVGPAARIRRSGSGATTRCVVVGRSQVADAEVDAAACRDLGCRCCWRVLMRGGRLPRPGQPQHHDRPRARRPETGRSPGRSPGCRASTSCSSSRSRPWSTSLGWPAEADRPGSPRGRRERKMKVASIGRTLLSWSTGRCLSMPTWWCWIACSPDPRLPAIRAGSDG